MKNILTLVVLSAGILMPNSVASKDLPLWNLSAVCAKEPDPACSAFEANAYSRLSGTWQSIPTELKIVCLENLESSNELSYRTLKDCLEHELISRQKRAPQ